MKIIGEHEIEPEFRTYYLEKFDRKRMPSNGREVLIVGSNIEPIKALVNQNGKIIYREYSVR